MGFFTVKRKLRIKETVSSDGFFHPGIGCSAATLTALQDGVTANRRPWCEYYEGLTASAARGARFIPQILNNDDIAAFRHDAETAWSYAVMYVVTGDEEYRRLPCEIIRWYGGVSDFFPVYFADSHIKLGKYVYTMCAAAEIMRYTEPYSGELAVTDRDISALGRAALLPIHEKSLHHNGYFMNQHSYAIIGSLAYAVMTDNRALYNEIVEWTTVNSSAENPGRNGSIAGVIRRVARNDLTGEETEPNIQLIEMGRDQPHAAGNLDNLLMMTRTMELQHTRVDRVTGAVTEDEAGISPLHFLDDRLLCGHYLYLRHNIGLPVKWIPSYAESGNAKIKIVYDAIAPHGYGSFSMNGVAAAYFYYRGIGYDETDRRFHLLAALYRSLYPRFSRAARRGAFISSIHNYAFDFFAGLSPSSALGDDFGSECSDASLFINTAIDLSVLDGTCEKYLPLLRNDSFIRLHPSSFARSMAAYASLKRGAVALELKTDLTAELTLNFSRDMGTLEAHTVYISDTGGERKFFRLDLDYDFDGIMSISVSTPDQLDTTAGSFDPDRNHIDLFSIHSLSDDEKCSSDAAPTLFDDHANELEHITFVGRTTFLDMSAVCNGKRASYAAFPCRDGCEADISSSGILKLSPNKSGDFDIYVKAECGCSQLLRRVRIHAKKSSDDAKRYALAPYNSELEYEPDSYKMLSEAMARYSDDMDALHRTAKAMRPLSPLLSDGSLDYGFICVSSIPEAIKYITDGNRYTFYSIWDECRAITFDFGENYRIAPRAFGIRARVSFPTRVNMTSFFGSDDGNKWCELTEKAGISHEMQLLHVKPDHLGSSFRYIKAYRAPDADVPILDIGELRIFGDRRLKITE